VPSAPAFAECAAKSPGVLVSLLPPLLFISAAAPARPRFALRFAGRTTGPKGGLLLPPIDT
jgi:hypothetical protein